MNESYKPTMELPVVDNDVQSSTLDALLAELRKNLDPELEKRFTYHSPLPGQPEKYQKIRDQAKELAYLIKGLCPNSRERNFAFTTWRPPCRGRTPRSPGMSNPTLTP